MNGSSIHRSFVSLILGAGLCTTAVSQQPEQSEIAALKADVATLNGMLPSHSHTMVDVECHFANLWFAGNAGNWPLATYADGQVIVFRAQGGSRRVAEVEHPAILPESCPVDRQ